MPRIYLEQTLSQDQIVNLSKEQLHYLGKVLRLKASDNFNVFNAHSGEWLVNYADLRCRKQLRLPKASATIWLAFAPLKHDPTTFLIEKSTELGVTNLQPIYTEHTNTKRINLVRLQANAREAAQQSERLDIPQILEPKSLAAFLAVLPEEVAWYAALERMENGDDNYSAIAAQGENIKCANAQISGSKANVGNEQLVHQHDVRTAVGFIIGPEGGWSVAERALLRSKVKALSLGANILRAETAALVCLSWNLLLESNG